MKIISLVENTSSLGFPTEHGLSLFIQTAENGNILFDMGQDDLFVQNAERLGLSLADVDIAVISHGHYDHGGGLPSFLKINQKAPVYISRSAFENHYSFRDTGMTYIGLDQDYEESHRLIKIASYYSISSGLELFSDVASIESTPHGNRLLFGPEHHVRDDFRHEQNLLIKEGENLILFAGCAHAGIINIMQRACEIAGRTPSHVFSGMHLVKSGLSEQEESDFILSLADKLLSFDDCQYYTMHCTGVEQFEQLKKRMHERIKYLSCGEFVIV